MEVFVLERNTGKLGGFHELNIRNHTEATIAEDGWAEGSQSPRVPYGEGWYMDKEPRTGGRHLMLAAEQWQAGWGFPNWPAMRKKITRESSTAHSALGFEEVDRIVCFLKRLP